MELAKRRDNRLREFDYSAGGAYFVTICVEGKKCLLGRVGKSAVFGNGIDEIIFASDEHGIMHHVGDGLDRPAVQLSRYGKVVEQDILEIVTHYENVHLDAYAIMPNHVHLLLVIDNAKVSGRSRPSPTSGDTEDSGKQKKLPTLGTIIGLFKSGVSRKVGFSIWQRSYYDHIIRDGKDYDVRLKYILENPQKWELDKEYVKFDV